MKTSLKNRIISENRIRGGCALQKPLSNRIPRYSALCSSMLDIVVCSIGNPAKTKQMHLSHSHFIYRKRYLLNIKKYFYVSYENKRIWSLWVNNISNIVESISNFNGKLFKLRLKWKRLRYFRGCIRNMRQKKEILSKAYQWHPYQTLV